MAGARSADVTAQADVSGAGWNVLALRLGLIAGEGKRVLFAGDLR
jgi:hypothetical protein